MLARSRRAPPHTADASFYRSAATLASQSRSNKLLSRGPKKPRWFGALGAPYIFVGYVHSMTCEVTWPSTQMTLAMPAWRKWIDGLVGNPLLVRGASTNEYSIR